MKLLIAALLLMLALAGTGAAFAIWPVVADAPWEETAEPPADRTREIRCEAALSLRQTIIGTGRYAPYNNPTDYEAQLHAAEREITRYCE